MVQKYELVFEKLNYDTNKFERVWTLISADIDFLKNEFKKTLLIYFKEEYKNNQDVLGKMFDDCVPSVSFFGIDSIMEIRKEET